ncbi:MAG: GNAT family N-acetyltransferase [Halocynthiibacter sp.]
MPRIILKEVAADCADALGLLRQSHALMNATFPAEANHYLSVDALKSPHISFWLAYIGPRPMGCCALARFEDYGEVKSLFVEETARGTGVARALLRLAEDTAREADLRYLRLETGDRLVDAIRLYEAYGFEKRSPFGTYEEGPHSVFFERDLAVCEDINE